MARKDRTVGSRHKALEPVVPEAPFTLAAVRLMYTGVGGKEHRCTIVGHCRTWVFEFPRINFRPDSDETGHYVIHGSPSIQACVTTNLVDHFQNMTPSRHYALSPSLRHVVSETAEEIKSKQGGRPPVFVVIEEHNELAPVDMINGECSIMDEMFLRDGEKTPALIGGRDGEQFVTAWPTPDGAWPELPNNHPSVNLILAGVRVAQQTSDPISKYVDQSCFITEDGRFVTMMPPARVTARGSTAVAMDAEDLERRATEIRNAIDSMEPDLTIPHMALLIDSMYSDEHKDDAYKRLEYLRLWQSLFETAKKHLGYHGCVKKDDGVLAGNKSLEELTNYRDEIAHWWTDTLDENFLADLRCTINELMRRKYF